MYLQENKSKTNIDDELDNSNGVLGNFFNIFNQYKKLIIIGVIAIILIIIIAVVVSSTKNNKNVDILELYGPTDFTIYKDSNYVDFGYAAYNAKQENLTKEIAIEGKVDATRTGDYEVKYTFGNIVKTRKIKVVEKDNNNSYIFLKGETNIKLKINDIYNDPGYEVFDSLQDIPNEDVITVGKIDTTTKGTYKLIYIVTDSSGVTLNAIRTITVS